jgi:two-component system response regulator
MKASDAVEILLIEDNPDDAGLTIHALKKHNLANNLLHLHDGEEALTYLFSNELTRYPEGYPARPQDAQD